MTRSEFKKYSNSTTASNFTKNKKILFEQQQKKLYEKSLFLACGFVSEKLSCFGLFLRM